MAKLREQRPSLSCSSSGAFWVTTAKRANSAKSGADGLGCPKALKQNIEAGKASG